MNSNPFALIDTPWGKMEAWRASTMATGTMGALSSVYDIVRTDAAAQAARADEAEARNALIQHVCDKIAEFEKRFDALAARLAAAEDKRRADEAAAREFEEEPLTLPPDIRELSPPKAIGDDTPAPSGELHAIAAKEEPSSELPEPALEIGGDDMGGVPMSYRNVPMSYVRGASKDQAGDLPEELEDPPEPVPEPRGSVYPQPVAIQLNKE
jgi:hypothetical protein